jgi:hypothetical protein
MFDARSARDPLVAALDQRAAVLARLLESHPALHLLAEYEAVFLDRRLSIDRRDDGGEASAGELLARMDAAITALEHGTTT